MQQKQIDATNEELRALIKEIMATRAKIQDSEMRAMLFRQADAAVKVLRANGGDI